MIFEHGVDVAMELDGGAGRCPTGHTEPCEAAGFSVPTFEFGDWDVHFPYFLSALARIAGATLGSNL